MKVTITHNGNPSSAWNGETEIGHDQLRRLAERFRYGIGDEIAVEVTIHDGGAEASMHSVHDGETLRRYRAIAGESGPSWFQLDSGTWVHV